VPTILQKEFDVEVDGEKYSFRMPSVHYDIEVAAKAAEIRRRAVKTIGYLENGLDTTAMAWSRYCAILELYLVHSPDEWCVSPGADKKPQVVSDEFPLDRTETVYALGAGFEAEMSRFRSRRGGDRRAGGEAVAGVENPGTS
jgi:hypothetical protein